MATFNTSALTTINKDTAGTWTSASCLSALTYNGVITAGSLCSTASGTIYQDDNLNCFECVGYSTTEVRTLKYGSNIVYVKKLVSFDSDGGTSVSDKYVYYGSNRTYGTLSDPTKTCYTFDGWYDAATSGTQVTSSTVVSSTDLTQTLYAYWTAVAPSCDIGTFSAWTNTSSCTTTYGTGACSSTTTKECQTVPLCNTSAFTGWTYVNSCTVTYGTGNCSSTTTRECQTVNCTFIVISDSPGACSNEQTPPCSNNAIRITTEFYGGTLSCVTRRGYTLQTRTRTATSVNQLQERTRTATVICP